MKRNQTWLSKICQLFCNKKNKKNMTKFKTGDKCVFLGAQVGKAFSNINLAKGTKVTILGPYNYSGQCGSEGYNLQANGINAGFAYAYELGYDIIKIEDLEKEITDAKSELEIMESKLEFIKQFGLKSFDEEEFKAYKVLKVMGFDDIEKAKEIVKILK